MDRLIDNEEIEVDQDEQQIINQEVPQTNGKLTGYLMFCLIVAAFGAAFQFGWSIGVFNTPSQVIQDFYTDVFTKRNETLSKDKLDDLWALTNGLLPFGGMFGGLLSGYVADRFGRKFGLLFINILVVIAGFLNIISKFINSYETIIIGRFISGLFCGLFSGILPLYLSELSPKNLRGSIGTLNQLMIVFGILITNILGLPQLLGTSKLWPVLVGLSLVPAAVHLLLFASAESPKHLVINMNDIPKAKLALLKLRNNDAVLTENEIDELKTEKERLSLQTQVRWIEFLYLKSLRRPLIVTVVIQLSQQLSGINAVIFYSKQIFENAGLKGSWPTYATIILGVVQLIMTFVCLAIVDKLGRKILLITGMIGMSLSSFALATFRILSERYTDTKYEYLNILTVVSAIIYIIFFSIGPGAIPWLITSELFASDSRGKATSIAVFVNWFSNFLVTVSFIYIEKLIGSYSFIIFGSLIIFFALFMIVFVPETKNKRIEDIVRMFEERVVFFSFFS